SNGRTVLRIRFLLSSMTGNGDVTGMRHSTMTAWRAKAGVARARPLESIRSWCVGRIAMPLCDHFQPPLSDDWPWDGVHSAWANAIAAQLNHGILPAGYYAIPQVKRGSQIEIDVATLQQPGGSAASESGTPTAVWTPPRPGLSEIVDFTDLDLFEVQIYRR